VNQVQPSENERPSTPMTLDVKVLAAVASLVVLLVVAVAIAIALVITIGHNANLAERHARFTDAVKAAALHAKGLANDERGYFISGNDEFAAQMEGRIDLARAAFESAEQSASANQRGTLAEAREGFERWLTAVDEEIALYRSGDTEAAIEASLGPTRTLRKAYEGWLSDASSLGTAGFQDATSAVTMAAVASVLILVAYLMIAVILGVFIGLWVVRTVLRPTYALVRMLSDPPEQSTQRPT
jgi:methyl-accepting chemotaxis protein